MDIPQKISSLLLAATTALIAPTASAALITSFDITGNVDAEVAAYADGYATSSSGTLTLSSITGGATIERATLYANNYFSSTTATAIFDGTALGSTTPYASDGGFYSYQWDVTSLITGNGSYSASYSGMTNSYGLALAVVFSDPSLPYGRVLVNDGAIDVTGGTESTNFGPLADAGAGELWIHTGADNALGQSGEEISLNGTVLGGPIDANLGDYASLFQFPVSTLAGVNTASIYDPNQDQFGWDLAVLTTSAVPSVPEPAGLALLGIGLLGIGFARRSRS